MVASVEIWVVVEDLLDAGELLHERPRDGVQLVVAVVHGLLLLLLVVVVVVALQLGVGARRVVLQVVHATHVVMVHVVA